MTETLSPAQTRYMRLLAQRLHPAESTARVSVAQLLKDVCGVQAQEPSAADMAVWVRGSSLLARHNGNVTVAAGECGIERQALQRLMRRYGIVSADFKKNQ